MKERRRPLKISAKVDLSYSIYIAPPYKNNFPLQFPSVPSYTVYMPIYNFGGFGAFYTFYVTFLLVLLQRTACMPIYGLKYTRYLTYIVTLYIYTIELYKQCHYLYFGGGFAAEEKEFQHSLYIYI